ncbi:hypothetical protein [Providencia alcalifaciens]|uniref:hypothetical protein n=1 Tax=Providencia sp. TaxID=589 RepID=UPI0022260ED1|nr:hypothetical protein [Providencia alcalifaciens]
MSGGAAGKIYSDLKSLVKKVLKISVATIALIIISSASYYIYEEYRLSSAEEDIISKAMPFVETHNPILFYRNEFGVERNMYVWPINDTDSHVVIKIDNKYAVYYSDFSSAGVIRFNRKAGDICSYAAAIVDNNTIVSIECNNDIYFKKLVNSK